MSLLEKILGKRSTGRKEASNWNFKDPRRSKYPCPMIDSDGTAEGCTYYGNPLRCYLAEQCFYVRDIIGTDWEKGEQVWRCGYCGEVTHGVANCSRCSAPASWHRQQL